MNDSPDIRGTSNTGLTLMGFALGAVVGAGLALLLAPDSGKKTRQRLVATAQRWSKSAESTIDQARVAVTELGTDAKAALKAGQESFLRDSVMHETRSERRLSHADETAQSLNAANRSSGEVAR